MAAAKPRLLLLRRVDATFSAALRARFRVLDFYASGAPLRAFLAAAAAEPEPPRAALVVAGGAVLIDAAFLDAVPSLRCVVTTGAGVDHVDLAQCARRGVAVAGAGEIFSVDVADHAVGLLIAVLRRVSTADRFVRAGLWPAEGDYPLTSKLSGKRVGIIGLGSIGSLIAKRLVGFGCVVSYHSRAPKATVPYRFFPDVRALAADSDALVVACALNDATRRIVGRRVLEALGPAGVVVNIARGGNVDEQELVAALREGRIAGAGLDVFENEPHVPPELRRMDCVVLTAHEAVFTEESTADLRDLMIENLEAFFYGKPLLTPVPLPL
ncbi:Glyoxylate/hydroxypyruvate reductase HPR3 [Dichanthelium oligosanthes]|uniref:Glyoxylate/hydroxypyruvate reductase HPR3 n=1 Tax=Dichanthelium oligosanthes TaxID=888268 RepID=A0A1E5V2R1_9POAL|nr:Glyoxylate/hydroxypyruvate reductase HPR3 [Dichanthelium oligosanthes]